MGFSLRFLAIAEIKLFIKIPISKNYQAKLFSAFGAKKVQLNGIAPAY